MGDKIRRGIDGNFQQKVSCISNNHGKGVDRLSSLPSEILTPILSKLSLKEACQTSTLSKFFRPQWHKLDVIEITEQHIKSTASYREKFTEEINKFVVTFRMEKETFERKHTKELERWVNFLKENKVKEIKVLWVEHDNLDKQSEDKKMKLQKPLMEIFQIPTLECLTLENTKYLLLPNDGINLPKLHGINFQISHFDQFERLNQLITGCPTLEKVKLEFGMSLSIRDPLVLMENVKEKLVGGRVDVIQVFGTLLHQEHKEFIFKIEASQLKYVSLLKPIATVVERSQFQHLQQLVCNISLQREFEPLCEMVRECPHLEKLMIVIKVHIGRTSNWSLNIQNEALRHVKIIGGLNIGNSRQELQISMSTPNIDILHIKMNKEVNLNLKWRTITPPLKFRSIQPSPISEVEEQEE